jgi:PAS domain S-box-containing protein
MRALRARTRRDPVALRNGFAGMYHGPGECGRNVVQPRNLQLGNAAFNDGGCWSQGMGRMKINPQFRAVVFRVGLVLGVLGAATAISLACGRGLSGAPFGSPYFFAVFIGVWFGGRAAGAATVVLSILILSSMSAYLPPPTVVALGISFVGADLLSNRRHHTESALRSARDRLATTVQELQTTARELSAEIDERKRAEATVRHTEERWRRMFEASTAGMALARPDGVFTAANPAFQKMLGYSEDEIKGKTAVGLNHPDERPATAALIDDLNTGVRQEYHAEKRYLHKDGTAVWLNITTTVVPATDNAPPFLQAIYIDISARKCAEEALRQSQAELARVARLKMMGELTASIAHEINQPLAAIVASGEACRRWMARDLSRAADSLNHMIDDARRASEIIQRIRSMTKQSASERVTLEVDRILDDVLEFTRHELSAKGVSLERRPGTEPLHLMGDRIELQQVVLNLVINGVEAMAEIDDRPRVLTIISGRDDLGQVLVDVEDSGVGLNGNDELRVFEPFYTTKPEGMGLGLSISTSIVEAHGGRLWATRRSPNGTAFHFTLPRAEGDLNG